MFGNILRKMQSIIRGERTRRENRANGASKTRPHRVSLRSRAALVVAAVTLATILAGAGSTYAQSQGYWASDGCYYQSNGYQWQATQCYRGNFFLYVSAGTWFAYDISSGVRWKYTQWGWYRTYEDPNSTVITGNNCAAGTFGCRYPQ